MHLPATETTWMPKLSLQRRRLEPGPVQTRRMVDRVQPRKSPWTKLLVAFANSGSCRVYASCRLWTQVYAAKLSTPSLLVDCVQLDCNLPSPRIYFRSALQLSILYALARHLYSGHPRLRTEENCGSPGLISKHATPQRPATCSSNSRVINAIRWVSGALPVPSHS